MVAAAYWYRMSNVVSLCLSVCRLLVAFVNPAKTGELIEMLFGGLSQVGHVLNGGPGPPVGRDKFWGLSAPLKNTGSLCCGVRNMVEPIKMPFGADLCGPKEPHITGILYGGRGRTNPFATARGDKLTLLAHG